MEKARAALRGAKRLVVKVGTSTLTHPDGRPNGAQMERLARELAELRHEGRDVVLVTSGAVACGRGRVRTPPPLDGLVDKQALAAVGQALLMQIYERLFAVHGCTIAQVLLTREDVAKAARRANARNTLARLLEWGVIPVVNENDTVAVEEIQFGDNDVLSALVARLVGADLLVLLTDTEGLYTADPRSDAAAVLVPVVTEVTPELEKAAGGAGSPHSRGGMQSKVAAARLATEAGVAVVIARGGRQGVLRAILSGEAVGTLFLPRPRGGVPLEQGVSG
ncbi:MAG: glutamate 5-kinase [Clostridia bacterium]|nr:glutamate 5-kinase [Clostridia bacterium]